MTDRDGGGTRAGTEPAVDADPPMGDLEMLSAQLDAIVESAPLGIGLFDRDVRHVRVNPVLAEMNGLPVDALLGRTPAELHGSVGREAEELYRRVMSSGEGMRDVLLTGEVGARPGDERHWSASFFPVHRGGDVIGLCVIVDDVTAEHRLSTELARSEERYRRLADDLQHGLLPPVMSTSRRSRPPFEPVPPSSSTPTA